MHACMQSSESFNFATSDFQLWFPIWISLNAVDWENILTVKEAAAICFDIACFRNKMLKVTKAKFTEEVLVGYIYFQKNFKWNILIIDSPQQGCRRPIIHLQLPSNTQNRPENKTEELSPAALDNSFFASLLFRKGLTLNHERLKICTRHFWTTRIRSWR